MTIDEFIKELESKAELEKERAFYDAVKWNCITAYGAYCRKLESEYRQLAEWLKDYKRLLEQEPCEDVISREEALQALCKAVHRNDDTIPYSNQRVSCLWSNTKVQDYAEEILKLPSVTPQPCDDAISRQAVLDYIYNDLGLGDEENGKDAERQMELESSYKFVKSLSPVALQPKMGRWIKTDEGFSLYKCSVCASIEFKESNYCPNCGCKMSEVEE